MSGQKVEEDDKDQERKSLSFDLQRIYDMKNRLNYGPREFICGWGAALINITVTYPIYKLIFRQMLHGVEASNAFLQLKHEGIRFLYRGMLPPLCQKTASLSIMFGIYEEVKRPLNESNVNPLIAKAAAGMVAGTFEAVLTPFERIQTLLQDQKYHKQFSNTHHAFQVIRSDYGLREYYRGLTPILLRNGPTSVLFFVLRDEAKLVFPHHGAYLAQVVQDFVSGACIGAFISTLFYPCNVLKVHIQSTLGGPFENSWKVFRQLYSEKGFRWMYSGVHLNYSRAFISWGVINASYNFLKDLMY